MRKISLLISFLIATFGGGQVIALGVGSGAAVSGQSDNISVVGTLTTGGGITSGGDIIITNDRLDIQNAAPRILLQDTDTASATPDIGPYFFGMGGSNLLSMYTKAGNINFKNWNSGKDFIFTDTGAGNVTINPDLEMNGSVTAPWNFATTVTSTKACAAGYSRITPNWCLRDTQTSTSSIPSATCTTIAAPDGDATSIILSMASGAGSNNAIGQRWAHAYQHTTSGCISVRKTLIQHLDYEEVAIGPGTVLSQSFSEVTVANDSVGGSIYIKASEDAGTYSSVSYGVIGYYD